MALLVLSNVRREKTISRTLFVIFHNKFFVSVKLFTVITFHPTYNPTTHETHLLSISEFKILKKPFIVPSQTPVEK